MLSLGKTGTDRITGFTGVITGFCSYLTGCNQLLLTPKIKGDGSLQDARWYDEQRIDIDLSVPVVVVDNGNTPGADVPAPIR